MPGGVGGALPQPSRGVGWRRGHPTHNKEYTIIPLIQGPYLEEMQDLYHQQYHLG